MNENCSNLENYVDNVKDCVGNNIDCFFFFSLFIEYIYLFVFYYIKK